MATGGTAGGSPGMHLPFSICLSPCPAGTAVAETRACPRPRRLESYHRNHRTVSHNITRPPAAENIRPRARRRPGRGIIPVLAILDAAENGVPHHPLRVSPLTRVYVYHLSLYRATDTSDVCCQPSTMDGVAHSAPERLPPIHQLERRPCPPPVDLAAPILSISTSPLLLLVTVWKRSSTLPVYGTRRSLRSSQTDA
ncbi:hypothetical protein DFH06DRAFT_1320501 [Mycena polygramma]|nr:hypothetical protein DFH06DRAFT_1320501 [Mycena polygramma]